MKYTRNQILKFFILFIFFFLCLVLFFNYTNDLNLIEIFSSFHLDQISLFLILIIFLINESLNLINNWLLIKNLYKRVSYISLALITYSSKSLTYIIMSKIDIPVRFILSKKIIGVPYNVSATTKLSLVLINLLITNFISIFCMHNNHWLPIEIKLFIIIFCSVLSIIIVFLFLKQNIVRIFDNTYSSKLINKIFSFILKILNSRIIFSNSTILIIALNLIFRIIIFTFATFYFFTAVLYIDIRFLDVLTIQVINSMVSLFSFLPNGIGTKDLSLIYLYSILGINKEEIILVASFERVLWDVIPFIIGVFSISNLGFQNIKNYFRQKTL